MPKVTSVFTFCFFFMVFGFLAVHYTQVKGGSQYREIASWQTQAKPMYDASFKL